VPMKAAPEERALKRRIRAMVLRAEGGSEVQRFPHELEPTLG
jgi:hypothetical protein